MKRIFKNKLGITLLEGLIALGLLSLAATATFGVLLSTSRKSSRSDIHEEMLLAVERAHERLQMYNGLSDTELGNLPNQYKGLCGRADGTNTDSNPLGAGTHTITCMLPPLCDLQRDSSFSYTVKLEDMQAVQHALFDPYAENAVANVSTPLFQRKNIQFDIKCNGFTLTDGAN